jgi:hypothetical protein
MLKAIYLTLALVATAVCIWQIGFLFNLPGSPKKPDYFITLTALTAAMIFYGLWLAGVIHRERQEERMFT